MADSLLETSLHLVHDLAQLPSACVAVIRLRTNERQTRVISQKQLARWASHASLKGHGHVDEHVRFSGYFPRIL